MEECACTCDVDEIFKHDDVMEALFSDQLSMEGTNGTYNLLKLLCETNVVQGDHATAGSASDPTFWPVHGTVERWLQLLRLEDRFTNDDWTTPLFTSNIHPTTDHCYGHNANDTLIFGLVDGNNFTNLEYYNYITPDQPYTPYIYDHFRWEVSWGPSIPALHSRPIPCLPPTTGDRPDLAPPPLVPLPPSARAHALSHTHSHSRSTTHPPSTAARWATRSANSTRTACNMLVTRICTRGLACRPQKRSSTKSPPARGALDRPSLDRQSRRAFGERMARRRRMRLSTIPRSRTL